MSVGLSALLLSSPILAKSNHVSLKVNPITGNQTSVNGETTKLATIKVLHNKTLLGKGTASKRGAFKITLKVPIKNGWKYTIQATKRGFAAKKYTVTALYASTKTDQAQSNNYQDEIHDLQNTIVSLQSQLNDLKNKPQQATTTDQAQSNNYQNEIHDLQNTIVSLQSQLNDLKNKPQQATTTIINGDSGTEDGSDSYDKNKDYWSGTSQNMYVDDGSVMLYTDGNSGSDSVDRVFGKTDKIHTIKTWVNNSVEGLYPVEYNGQKLFVDKGDVTKLDADNSSNQLYYKDGSYFANYSPEKSNVKTFNGLYWNEYTPTGIYYWKFRDGSWHDDSNDSNPAPTANQKKIKELQDQIQTIDKQRSAINQNMAQVETSINKSDPNENEDIPSSEKLDEYNTGESIDQLKESLSYRTNDLATDTEKLNKLNSSDDDYYVVTSKIKQDNEWIERINKEISDYNSMTKTIAGFGGQAGYLKKAQEYLDQYNALKSKLSDLTKQSNDLNNQINSLEAQIDTLENQQD